MEVDADALELVRSDRIMEEGPGVNLASFEDQRATIPSSKQASSEYERPSGEDRSTEELAVTNGEKPAPAAAANVGTSEPPPLPTGSRLLLIIFSACIGILLQALDSTIISTAIPKITDDFDSVHDVGWYGSAYFLTQCASQLLWGRLFTFFDLKLTYIVSIAIFEVGSLLCAVAPDSPAFIVGRAIAGLGGAGVFAGSFVIVAFSVPLIQRPLYASYLGAMYGVASVIGPLVGGAFTDRLSWRGCFYLNLPLGAAVIVGLVFFFTSPHQSARLRQLPGREKLNRLDPIGTVVFVSSVICLLLALQWGGSEYNWSDVRIIVLFVVFGLTFVAWLGWQIRRGDIATVPARIIRQRSLSFATFYSLCMGGVNFVILYYVPIWFQAVKGVSAVQSGIDILPFIVGLTVTVLGTGYILSKFGYSAPFMLLSVVLVSTACGLMTTWSPATGHAQWIGYLALYGLGQGFGWQQPILIAQTVLAAPDIPTGTALTTVCKLLGGTVFISVGENVFTTHLIKNIQASIPDLDPSSVLDIGTTDLRKVLPPAVLGQTIVAYNDALSQVFFITVGLSCMAIIGALGVEWRSVKNKKSAEATPPKVEREDLGENKV